MGNTSLNMQTMLAANECKKRAVKEFGDKLFLDARNQLGRELDLQEREIVNKELNNICNRRKKMLEQLRNAKKAELHPVPYSSNHELEINRIVDGLLKDNPNYEVPETIQNVASDPNSPEGILEGFLSDITGAMGGPFALIGQLFKQIFSYMIKGFKKMGEMTKGKAESFFQKGKLEDAEVTLRQEERDGFEKVARELREITANAVPLSPLAVAATNLSTELNNYCTELAKFEKKELLEHPALSEEYRLENLQLRIDEFNKFNDSEKEFSKLYEAEMRLKKEIERATKEQTEINHKLRVATPTEGAYLRERLLGVQAELGQKNVEQTNILDQERAQALQFTTAIQNIHAKLIDNTPGTGAKHKLNAERNKPAIGLGNI